MYVLLRDSSVPIEIVIAVPENWWTVHGADVRLYTEEVHLVEPICIRVGTEQSERYAQVAFRPRGLAAPSVERFVPIATPQSTTYITTLISQAPNLAPGYFRRILASLRSRDSDQQAFMHHQQSATVSIISQLGG